MSLDECSAISCKPLFQAKRKMKVGDFALIVVGLEDRAADQAFQEWDTDIGASRTTIGM